ncbi:MAG: hypothetical protein AAF244_00255 [Pseudomonadota bacterium]
MAIEISIVIKEEPLASRFAKKAEESDDVAEANAAMAEELGVGEQPETRTPTKIRYDF